MKINFTILFTLFFSFSFSQSIIFDNINTNGGKINDENINVTFTIGQPIVGTISNQSNTISQGFQQNYKVEGCTDENACNFDPSANVENGECIYPSSSEESIDESMLQEDVEEIPQHVIDEAKVDEEILNRHDRRQMEMFNDPWENWSGHR